MSKYDQLHVNMMNEIILLNTLKHQNILRSFGTGFINARWWQNGVRFNGDCIATEFQGLGDLCDYIGLLRDDRRCRQAFKQILDGIAKIHEQNFVHRDIKVENVFVDETGTLKIGDLGFCERIDQPINEIGGSEHYMAPEIFEQSDYRRVPVDIYALGIALFVMRTSVYPFEVCKIEG